MDPDRFFLSPPAPKTTLPYLKLVRCKPGQHLSITIISSDVVGCRQHRLDGKPYLCPGEGCQAPFCPNSGRYEAYVEAIAEKEKKIVMVAFTEECYQKVRMISLEHGMCLRGLQLVLRREEGRPKGPIDVEFHGKVKYDRNLPPQRDMRPFVLRLYKVR